MTIRKPITLQPKQQQLLEAILDRRVSAATVLGFGGSRGSAKSGGIRRIAISLAMMDPKDLGVPEGGLIIWIIRRVWDDLNKDHVLPMFEEFPELKELWRAGEKKLQFANGNTIFFIHSGDQGRAKRKARGPAAHYIFLEQAEEFSQAEMEGLAGSNRGKGVGSGFCKRIYTFNPGGIGTAYLRRIFHLKQYMDNEPASDFMFIQGFGWDNFEWFRGLGIVSERDFYNDPAWSNDRRFEVFINRTDFGKRLNSLPQSQRIGELMGSFDKFAGQYYSEVWEEKSIILPQQICSRLIQPWWRRWLATDWGFSHYCSTGWFTSGLVSPEQVMDVWGVEVLTPVRVIIRYRELVCNDVAEPLLADTILGLTPEAERREIRDHWIGHDAWAKRGEANTVVEQMDPLLARGGMPRLSRATIDRVSGWRLLYNAWASARKLATWAGPGPFIQNPDEPPAFFISSSCPELISAVPMLICDEDNPQDVMKMAGQVSDDVADECRYGVKSYLTAEPNAPKEVVAMETYNRYQDPTARSIAMLQLKAKQDQQQYIRRRRHA